MVRVEVQRRFAAATLTLGSVITLVGGTGIFAVFTDRATTGTNSVASGERASAADLQIAPAIQNQDLSITCGTFSDDLGLLLFDISDAQPTGVVGANFICLSNVGSSSLSLTATAIDLVDVETDCTGDESAAGDNTCGSFGQGELSGVLFVSAVLKNCQTSAGEGGVGTQLGVFAQLNLPFGTTLAPDQVACLLITAEYPTDTPDSNVLVAQTDKATWRFAFDGATAA